MDELDELRSLLAKVSPGEIRAPEDVKHLSEALARCWHPLDGDEGGMEGYKLHDRMEDIRWEPPHLSFMIERHGGTVMGSSRAELQHWVVDVEKGTALLERTGHRQLAPMSPRLDVNPLVDEVVALIVAGQEDERLKWAPGHPRVTIRIGKIIPDDGSKQTVQGRRRRFRRRLQELMESNGWREVSGPPHHTYEKIDESAK